MSVIAFTKVAYPYGWLGNMAPHPVTYKGVAYRTTEHLFQCLRFRGDRKVQARIRRQMSPMGAKMAAKPFRDRLKVPLCDRADLKRMELCLRLKCRQHPELREKLIRTGSATIIEDCAKRPDIEIDGKNHGGGLPFWGARWNAGTREWDGQNALGVLLMKLRMEFQSGVANIPPSPPSFIGSQYSPFITSHTMKSINEKIAAAEATVTNLKRIKVTCKKVEALLKKEGYSSLEQFMAKIHAPAVEEKSAAIAPRAGRKGKRPRMTAAKVAKMKVLRATMSRKKVADRIGCSEQTVVNWENKKFVFTKR